MIGRPVCHLTCRIPTAWYYSITETNFLRLLLRADCYHLLQTILTTSFVRPSAGTRLQTRQRCLASSSLSQHKQLSYDDCYDTRNHEAEGGRKSIACKEPHVSTWLPRRINSNKIRKRNSGGKVLTKGGCHGLREYNVWKPCSRDVLQAVHAADHQCSLFVVVCADFICPRIPRARRKRVCQQVALSAKQVIMPMVCTHITAVMSCTPHVRKANSLSGTLAGQTARIPLGISPYTCISSLPLAPIKFLFPESITIDIKQACVPMAQGRMQNDYLYSRRGNPTESHKPLKSSWSLSG